MKKHIVRTVLALFVVNIVSAETKVELQKQLTAYQANVGYLTHLLGELEPRLQQKEANLATARARYTTAHDAWKGLNYRFHNIDKGYEFDEVSLQRARAQGAEEQAKLAKLLGELGDAAQRRAVASQALDEAKKYMLDPREAFHTLYKKAEERFSRVNDEYWKLVQEEGLARVRIDHMENVAIQLEDKVAEEAFVRLRDEVLKLRVQVKGLQMRQKQAAELVEAVSALLK